MFSCTHQQGLKGEGLSSRSHIKTFRSIKSGNDLNVMNRYTSRPARGIKEFVDFNSVHKICHKTALININ